MKRDFDLVEEGIVNMSSDQSGSNEKVTMDNDMNFGTDLSEYERSPIDVVGDMFPSWIIDRMGNGDKDVAIYNICRLIEYLKMPKQNPVYVFDDLAHSGEFDSVDDDTWYLMLNAVESWSQLWDRHSTMTVEDLVRSCVWKKHMKLFS